VFEVRFARGHHRDTRSDGNVVRTAEEAMNMLERDLRDRAKRLGYKLKKRGTQFELVSDDGSGCGADSIDGVNWWLDVIEYKTPVQFYSACGVPTYKINGDSAEGRRSSEETDKVIRCAIRRTPACSERHRFGKSGKVARCPGQPDGHQRAAPAVRPIRRGEVGP
jgi:hypothetical protein